MAEVTYSPYEPPHDLGWQNSSSGWYQTYLFGIYKVRFEDGFTVATAHTASPRTIGAEPIDLDLNPGYRDFLIEEAERVREQHA